MFRPIVPNQLPLANGLLGSTSVPAGPGAELGVSRMAWATAAESLRRILLWLLATFALTLRFGVAGEHRIERGPPLFHPPVPGPEAVSRGQEEAHREIDRAQSTAQETDGDASVAVGSKTLCGGGRLLVASGAAVLWHQGAHRVWALPFLTVWCPSERFYEPRGRRHPTLTERAGQMIRLVGRW